jgi:hypothetical protein
MKKVYQKEHNDCYRACIASIFELELEEVPHFKLASDDPMRFIENGGDIPYWDDWFKERGFVEVEFNVKEYEQISDELSRALERVPMIAVSRNHGVVWRRQTILFDPASNKPGFQPIKDFTPELFCVFVPINPHKHIERNNV